MWAFAFTISLIASVWLIAVYPPGSFWFWWGVACAVINTVGLFREVQ